MGYYSPPPPGHESPYHQQPSDDGNATAPLIVAILMTVFCNQIAGIIGIVFAALAMSSDRNPADREKYIRYSWNATWIGLAVTVGLVLLILAVFLVMFVAAA